MGEYLKIAVRNLIRQRRRTLLTGIGMAITAFLLVINQAHSDGLRQQLITNLIVSDSGHIRITKQESGKKKDSLEEALGGKRSFVTDPDVITRELSRDPSVRQVNAQITTNVMLTNGLKMKPGVVVGIEPEKERELFTQTAPPAAGEPIKQDGQSEAYISNSVAAQYALSVGDTLTVMAQTAEGGSNALDFTITGIFKTYSPRMTDYVFVGLREAQELLGIANQVTQLKVMLHNGDQAKTKAKVWEKNYGAGYSLDFTDWEEAGQFYAGSVIAFQFFGAVLSFMLFIVCGFGMMNTMLMAIFSRTREIGTMMALGAKRRQIIGVFLTEAALLGAVAAGVGVILGAVMTFWLHQTGIPALNESIRFAYESDRTYPYLSLANAFGSFGFVLGLAALASLYPVVKASRLKPVEALLYV